MNNDTCTGGGFEKNGCNAHTYEYLNDPLQCTQQSGLSQLTKKKKISYGSLVLYPCLLYYIHLDLVMSLNKFKMFLIFWPVYSIVILHTYYTASVQSEWGFLTYFELLTKSSGKWVESQNKYEMSNRAWRQQNGKDLQQPLLFLSYRFGYNIKMLIWHHNPRQEQPCKTLHF